MGSIVKLSYIGPMQTRPDGKTFREIGAEQWNGEKKSAWKTAPEFDTLKVGDEVDLGLSENGKYINFLNRGGANPTHAAGGKGWSKGSYSKAPFVPDPEKNTSVYVSYLLEHMLDVKQMKLSPTDAVKLLFELRAQVAKGFAANAAPKEPLQTDVENDIKITAAMALVKTIDTLADHKVWTAFILKAISRKGGYDMLIKNLNACLTREKDLDYTPDGIPAFINPGE